MAETSFKSERDTERQRVMAALAAAPTRALAEIWDEWADKPQTQRVRGPETGLVMVRGRTGGGGSPFNLGEATVTRATVRLPGGEIGHSYALGRDGEKAVVAATLDALWQTEARQRVMDAVVVLEQAALDADAQRRAETAATRVNFFTMVRGED